MGQSPRPTFASAALSRARARVERHGRCRSEASSQFVRLGALAERPDHSRVYLSLNKGHGLSDVFEPANAMRKHAESKARMVTPRELSAFLNGCHMGTVRPIALRQLQRCHPNQPPRYQSGALLLHELWRRVQPRGCLTDRLTPEDVGVFGEAFLQGADAPTATRRATIVGSATVPNSPSLHSPFSALTQKKWCTSLPR